MGSGDVTRICRMGLIRINGKARSRLSDVHRASIDQFLTPRGILWIASTCCVIAAQLRQVYVQGEHGFLSSQAHGEFSSTF